MAEITIAHPDLTAKGGAEAVAMRTLEALSDHDLRLLTITEPTWDDLNDYYNADVGDVTVVRAERLVAPFRRLVTSNLPIPRFRLLEQSLFDRFVQRRADDVDLVVSTFNELALRQPSLQYVHHPNYYFNDFPSGGRRDGRGHAVYSSFSNAVAGFDPERLSSTTLLANSEWTATAFSGLYGHRPAVVYPPVDTTGFDGWDWDERENGFVCISRLSPDKEVLQGLRIVDELVQRGHDVHVHVVGSITDERYHEEVCSFATDRPHIAIEGECTRTRLVELVCRHRYGLHTKPHEHFGIAVAELAAGGTVPFVPHTGGPSEIVGDELAYTDVNDAVELIDAVLSSPERQAELRNSLPNIEGTFGVERFHETIREAVGDALNGVSVER